MLFILVIINIEYTQCQKSLRIYLGNNISNCKYYLTDRATLHDTSYFKKKNIILPSFGFNMLIPINKDIKIISGLGLSWLGSKNYNEFVPDFINADHDLMLGYLKTPFEFEYKLTNYLKIDAGYSFYFNFRKNQVINAINLSHVIINIYHPFYNSLNFGVKFQIKNFDLNLMYQKGISRIWDSKKYDPLIYAHLALNSFQITVGYSIFDTINTNKLTQ